MNRWEGLCEVRFLEALNARVLWDGEGLGGWAGMVCLDGS